MSVVWPAASPTTRPLAWAGLLRIGALKWLAYRLSGFLKFFEFPLLIVVYSFLFRALYASLPTGQEAVGGLTLAATLTYVTLVWLIEGVLANSSDEHLGEDMRKGQIVVWFLRPISLQAFMWWEAAGEMAIRGLVLGGPLLAMGVLLFGLQPPPSWLHVGYFAISLALAAVLKFSMNFIVGLSALFFENNNGVVVMKISLMRGLGGLVLPLSLLPDTYREWCLLTPFPYLYYVPAQCYLGTLPPDRLATLLLVQGGWTLIFWLLGAGMERVARRMAHLQGG